MRPVDRRWVTAINYTSVYIATKNTHKNRSTTDGLSKVMMNLVRTACDIFL